MDVDDSEEEQENCNNSDNRNDNNDDDNNGDGDSLIIDRNICTTLQNSGFSNNFNLLYNCSQTDFYEQVFKD